MTDAGLSSLSFFQQLHGHYGHVLKQAETAGPDARASVIDALLAMAWGSFDANVEAQCEGLPALDCHKGCATCCTLRVTATAPEVLMLARFIRALHPALMQRGIDLPAQVASADTCTQGLNEPQRIAARQRCPFIAQGVCVIYQVRPLACRGLASYDKRACAQAASGKIDAIPYSEPHMRMRSLVQNALQSALRDSQLAWGSYELNQALTLALQDPALEQRWLAGDDVFAVAQVHEVDSAEMAAVFDELKRPAESHQPDLLN
jgi:Fe-S-cluster containining protein